MTLCLLVVCFRGGLAARHVLLLLLYAAFVAGTLTGIVPSLIVTTIKQCGALFPVLAKTPQIVQNAKARSLYSTHRSILHCRRVIRVS